MSTLFTLDNVSRWYGEVIALNAVSITVEPGEHGLTITRGDFIFHTDKFELTKRGAVRLSVTYLDGDVRVARADGTLLNVDRSTVSAEKALARA